MTSTIDQHDATRRELVFQLRHGDAHQTFLDAVADVPTDAINLRPPHVGYTLWQLVEHVRYCQFDMIDYLSSPSYRAVIFPDDYWPAPTREVTRQEWTDTVEAFRSDLDRVEDFVMHADLWTPAAHAWDPAHTPLRTVLVMIDHNAYHGGELGILRQTLGLWSPDRADAFNATAIHTQNHAE
jgi:DinB superfamily